ncbi:hypothetical protein [Flavobacterium tegetincola]|uniref:hypothetical protein n=1 Tax=Flavobacterium tegetincola TaxID=150172 RepID=UPI00047D4857|nr:hypothetical protein [Flavobacterium tegetincola]
MKNFTIYLVVSLCLFLAKVQAQDSFDMRVRAIANKIEMATKEEKAALKKDVEEVNVQLENRSISIAEADEKKKVLAEVRAKNIENRVAIYQKELNELVQLKVNGTIADNDTLKTKGGFKIIWDPKFSTKKDTLSQKKGEARTTSQFVFATGINNLVTDGAVANSDFRYMGSHFYEWGVTWNTRIAKENNLLHFKYGVSVMYNNLRATDNRYFVDNGTTTDLEVNPVNMKDSRFRNVNLVVPMHLEFDFSGKTVKDGKTSFRTHESVRFGIGGFAGVNLKSKQIIKYDIDGYKSREVTKGDFNANDFVYGVSTYIGYKSTSLYLKYDLSPLFEDNAIDQNNISLGIRFDLL